MIALDTTETILYLNAIRNQTESNFKEFYAKLGAVMAYLNGDDFFAKRYFHNANLETKTKKLKGASMKLEIFKNEKFEVRGGLVNGEPYFVANDISTLLGYANTYAMLERLDDDEKTNLKDLLKSRMPLSTDFELPDGVRYDAVLLRESGVYNAILWSQKQEAKKFRRWITDEVLPAIRKHGGYLTEAKIKEALLSPDTIIKLATDLKFEREKAKALRDEAELNKPYVTYAKAVEASATCALIGDFVKTLCDAKNVSVGRNRLFKWLRDKGYLMRDNTPYQKWVECGYFELVPVNIVTPKGNISKFTTYITAKGQVALSTKICDEFKISA